MDQRRKSFRCYFCNNIIENDTEMGHNSVCRKVLVTCPNSCGSYVPREALNSHMNECSNRSGRTVTKLTSIETFDNNFTLDRRPNISRDAVERLQRDFQTLSNRMTNYELSGRKNQDFENLRYQNQMIVEWKKAVDFKLGSLEQNLVSLLKSRDEDEFHLVGIQQKLMVVDNLQKDLNNAIDAFLEEQRINRQSNLEFSHKLDACKDLFEEDNRTMGTMWKEQKGLIEEIRQDLDSLRSVLEAYKTKNDIIIYDIKTLNAIASETADKVETQDGDFALFKKQFEQLKLDFDILENLASADARTSATGHLVWRVSDFEAKMSKSKEFNTILKSPIFYTHDFGYKIRVLAFLNGLKKWRDRYTLLSIEVLQGDYDPLLQWPCHIEGTVSLCDQERVENVKDFTKRIVAKRQSGNDENEEPQESSLSYIFISHSTLTKSTYLKNDEVFFKIRIEQNTTLGAAETNL